MKKFNCKLNIEFDSNKELRKFVPIVEKIGYKFSGGITNIEKNLNFLPKIYPDKFYSFENRFYVVCNTIKYSKENHELILALLHMNDDYLVHKGEYAYESLTRLVFKNNSICDILPYKKATFEQILKHFKYELKNNEIIKKMENKIKKVKCVDNEGVEMFLTVGKIYEVKEICYGFYHLFNDLGKEMQSNMKRFEEVNFPEKWILKEIDQDVVNWLRIYKNTDLHYCMNNMQMGIFYPAINNRHTLQSVGIRGCLPKDYEEITLDEFKENYINNKENMKNTEKEISHYEVTCNDFEWSSLKWDKGEKFEINGALYDYMNSLDLLTNPKICKPIYKSKEEIINIGFDVKINSEGIFHKSDNITTFVQEIIAYFITYQDKAISLGNYQAHIKDVEFSKTGCQTVPTKLSDWQKVWNKYQELK
jgi:hypothetical protein